MPKVIVHIANQDAIKADIDELPNPSDSLLVCNNPRNKGDGEVTWIEEGVNVIVIPWWRVNFIQVLPSEDDEQDFPMPFRND